MNRLWPLVFVFPLLIGCDGPQSALDPAGRGAREIYKLTLWMVFGGLAVWLVVMALAIYTIYINREKIHSRRAAMFIVVGGAVVPSFILFVLLLYGLSLMPDLIEPAPPGSLQIAVEGEQWWWRVLYRNEDGSSIELANEIRLPAGEPVQFHLTSADVVHSFWIPALGPKMDMIPGRETRLTLHPEKEGTFRGICAEYCGSSHALMALDVVVMDPSEFRDWLARQAAPSGNPASADALRGREVFLATGCGACHSVRGTGANGAIGPDLTHVGSRLTVAASLLPNDPDGFARFLTETERVKPDVLMPHFRMLPEDEIRALATYLDSLE